MLCPVGLARFFDSLGRCLGPVFFHVREHFVNPLHAAILLMTALLRHTEGRRALNARSGDVALASAHGEFAMIGRMSRYANGPEDALLLRAAGKIPDGVLSANVAGHAVPDTPHLVALFRDERFAT